MVGGGEDEEGLTKKRAGAKPLGWRRTLCSEEQQRVVVRAQKIDLEMPHP